MKQLKKNKLNLIVAVALSFLLCACGAEPAEKAEPEVLMPAETAVVTSAPTPEPTPEPVYDILGEQVSQSEIDAGYTFELFGQEVNTVETECLEYKKAEIGDEGLEIFRQVLPHMKGLNSLRFDRCGTSNEKTAQLRDEFPDANIVWRVYIGPYAIMTDEKTLWASCDVVDSTSDGLYYCTAMENLDLGHCALLDISFLENMPELKVLILSCGDVSDITPVKYCKKLEYLELAECRISDISAVAELKDLEHINIGGNQGITDFSPLYGLKKLKRCYAESIYNTANNMQEVEDKLKEELPGCDVDCAWYWHGSLNGGRWKYSQGNYGGHYVERYQQLRETFNYDMMESAKPYAAYLD